MKKKLIALGVAGALAAPLIASAQGTHVTIFGRIQAEYATVDVDGRGAQTGILDDAAQSRWGLQVAEDLGMGFRAMGRAEFGFNPGAGTTQTSREQWVGLGSNQWGEVKFGRVQSPFKDFAGGHTIDPFAYTSLHANGSGGLMVASENGLGSGDNSFANSSARYDSPVVEGFQMSALLMAGDAKKLDPTSQFPIGAGVSPNNNSGGEDGEWDFQVAGKYSGQFDALGVNIFGGYSRDNVSDRMKSTFGVNDDEEIWRGGALLSFADLRVRGQYEYVNNANPFGGAATCTQAAAFGTAAGSLSLDGGRGQCNSAMNANGDGYLWFAGIDYTIGNTMLIAQGGMGHAYGLGGGASSKDIENITAGVIHSLSRRSSLFGGYQRVWVKDKNLPLGQDADRNVYTVGLRHDF